MHARTLMYWSNLLNEFWVSSISVYSYVEWNGICCLNSRRLRLPVAHYREESPIMNPDSVAGPHDNQMVALLISCDSTSRDGIDPTSRLTA